MMNEKKPGHNSLGACIYVAMNMSHKDHGFIPRLPLNRNWYVIANTMMHPPERHLAEGKEALLEDSDIFLLGPYSLCSL